jgi:hypothetical protein
MHVTKLKTQINISKIKIYNLKKNVPDLEKIVWKLESLVGVEWEEERIEKL